MSSLPGAALDPDRRRGSRRRGAVIALSTLAWPERFVSDSSAPRFRFISTPEGANIIVNGVDTGLRTPADVEIARLPGKHPARVGRLQPFVTAGHRAGCEGSEPFGPREPGGTAAPSAAPVPVQPDAAPGPGAAEPPAAEPAPPRPSPS